MLVPIYSSGKRELVMDRYDVDLKSSPSLSLFFNNVSKKGTKKKRTYAA